MTGPARVGGSPSPGKPALAVERWLGEFGTDIQILNFAHANLSQICMAHDPKYVSDIFTGHGKNGFGTIDQRVTDTLAWTVGSMVAAARHALRTGETACSPTSGFHHAGYDFGEGYCTFNGLVVAAQMALEQKKQVAILDADQHFGNGTVDIIRRLKLPIRHWSVGETWNEPKHAESVLHTLPAAVEFLLTEDSTVDLLIYQAGADPHVDDPLGGWMTTEQLARRDEIVFNEARRLGVPVAWNLAGGYQEPFDNVLQIHVNTLRAALAAT